MTAHLTMTMAAGRNIWDLQGTGHLRRRSVNWCSMIRSRFLTRTGYGLAAVLVVLPVLEPIVTLLPPQPGEIAWRLQAFGVISMSLALPIAGGVAALVTAYLLEHRRVMRALAAGALLGALLITAAAAMFVLDLVQYRGAVPAELAEYYRAAGVVYLSAFALAAAFLAWIGIAAWRASRASKSLPSRRRRRTSRAARPEEGSALPADQTPRA
jgi:hypothetical protein